MNEGHSAFLPLERLRELLKGTASTTARRRGEAQCVFTTHTPVPAGNDVFDLELMQRTSRRSGELGLTAASCRVREVGRPTTAAFGLTPLAMRLRPLRTASPSCTARCRARCGASSGPTCPSTTCRSARSRTACTSARGSPDELEELLGYSAPELRARARAPRRRALVGPPRRDAAVLEFIARTRGAPRSRSRRADDRLRAPLRDLQARRAAAAASPSGSRACSATPTGRCSSSSRARRIRRTRAARN